MDAAANPYIALAAILAAGMLGLLVRCPLPDPLQVMHFFRSLLGGVILVTSYPLYNTLASQVQLFM